LEFLLGQVLNIPVSFEKLFVFGVQLITKLNKN